MREAVMGAGGVQKLFLKEHFESGSQAKRAAEYIRTLLPNKNDERNKCQIGSYSCQCLDGYEENFEGAGGEDCRQINECTEAGHGGHGCDLETEVCIDLAPPQTWECVTRTEAPSVAPVPVLSQPVSTRTPTV